MENDNFIKEDTLAVRDGLGRSIDPSAFTDYFRIKSLLHGRLINTEKNAEFLKRAPHREFLDLSLVYCVTIFFPGSSGGICMQVMDGQAELWKVSEQDMFAQAMENMEKFDKSSIVAMSDLFADTPACIPEASLENPFPMYILTNQRRFHGAVQMLNGKALEKAAILLGQDFFILPSSVHETILVPAEETAAIPKDLAAVVREVNEKEVLEEEFLSGHVYRYRAADREITIAA